jgi:hypothetical protein
MKLEVACLLMAILAMLAALALRSAGLVHVSVPRDIIRAED